MDNSRRIFRLPRPAFLLDRRASQRAFPPRVEHRVVSDTFNGAIRDRPPLILFDNSGHDDAPQSTQAPPSNDSTPAGVARGGGWSCLHCSAQILSNVLIFPATHFYHSAFHYVPDDDEEYAADDLTSTGIRIVSRQFETKIEAMVKAWDLIKLVSIFFIGAAPVILQIQPIYTNVITRATTVASGLLACASLICSYIYVLSKDRFIKRRSMDIMWKAASTSGGKFWKLVALPLAFVLWSLFFFLGTICYFIWVLAFAIVDDETVSREVQYVDMFISALFVTSLPIIAFFKIYGALKEINGTASD